MSALRRLGLSASAARDDQDLQGALRHRDHQQRLERRTRAVQRSDRGTGSASSRHFPRPARARLAQRIAKITHTRLVDPQTGAEIVDAAARRMQVRGPVVFDGSSLRRKSPRVHSLRTAGSARAICSRSMRWRATTSSSRA